MTLWHGRLSGGSADVVMDYSVSLHVDRRLAEIHNRYGSGHLVSRSIRRATRPSPRRRAPGIRRSPGSRRRANRRRTRSALSAFLPRRAPSPPRR